MPTRNRVLEQQALEEIPKLFAEWLAVEEPEGEVHPLPGDIDFVYQGGGYTFLIELKGSGTVSLIKDAIEQIRRETGLHRNRTTVPVVAVPYMGESGAELCDTEGVSWLDLSGNAHIRGPGLLIHVEGKPNKFKTKGRPKNLFAPKSSRIVRRLLLRPDYPYTQRQLTEETEVDEALVSRVVRSLEGDGLLIRDQEGAVRPKEPNLLLDAWYEAYSFGKHLVMQGFVAERSSDAVLRGLAQTLGSAKTSYAATGLAGAWLLTHFASFRLTTFYLRETPSEDLLRELRFRKQPSGGNVWLVVPNDVGVFDGASERDGIICAHPVQVYLDLKGHPERAKEAGAMVRQECLRWEGNAG